MERCDRCLPLIQYYTENQVRQMTTDQLKLIIVPQLEIGLSGKNLICRQCGWMLQSKLVKNGLYLRKCNLQDHLRSKYHLKEESELC